MDTVQRWAVGHFVLGGVYYDTEYDVPFTVTEIKFRYEDSTYFVTKADLDYPCYSQVQRTFRWCPWYDRDVYPMLWEPAENEDI